MNQTEWIKKFEALNCYWFHDSDPKRPHAELTSGKHSNGFFNFSKIIEDPELCEAVCQDLVKKLNLPIPFNGYVFGAALGAIELSYELGKQLKCKRGYTEPKLINGVKYMSAKRFMIISGASYLAVEDVLTTGDSIKNTMYNITGHNGSVIDRIAAVLNRSSMENVSGKKIIALINQPMITWKPNDCPLCSQGSIALRPKANWEALTR